jgi:hypothetical protein
MPSRIVTPSTKQPLSLTMSAATAESIPPLIATAIL